MMGAACVLSDSETIDEAVAGAEASIVVCVIFACTGSDRAGAVSVLFMTLSLG